MMTDIDKPVIIPVIKYVRRHVDGCCMCSCDFIHEFDDGDDMNAIVKRLSSRPEYRCELFQKKLTMMNRIFSYACDECKAMVPEKAPEGDGYSYDALDGGKQ